MKAIPEEQRERLKEYLRAPRSSLRYRWARAVMLMASLRQMGAGEVHPLRRAAFEPFQEDYKALREKFQALKQDVETLGTGPVNSETEENLTRSVDHLLRRIYAYFSWGIRHQADSDQEVRQTLEELGFRVPPTGDRRLFDIVVPAALFIALITFVFSIAADEISLLLKPKGLSRDEVVKEAASAALAASLMYGGAVWIALRGRSTQIQQRVWSQAGSRRLAAMALQAGLLSWGVIILSTILVATSDTWRSLVSLCRSAKSLATGYVPIVLDPEGTFLPWKMVSALPWLIAGATVSVLLSKLLGGRARGNSSRRVQDALVLGGGLALAASLAFLIQTALDDPYLDGQVTGDLILTGLAALACGAAIGFTVPEASRSDLVHPYDLPASRALRDLLHQAEAAFRSKSPAEDWAFEPHRELGGITPAEAVRYPGYAEQVRRLLEAAAPHPAEDETRTRPDAVPDDNERRGGMALGPVEGRA